MSTATISTDPDDPAMVLVRFPYDPAAVDAIKRLPTRRWDKYRKAWVVPIDLRDQARATLERIGIHVEDASTTSSTGTVNPADAVAVLVKAVPASQRRGLLRKLAASTHPDVGGDGALSRVVNRLLDSTP